MSEIPETNNPGEEIRIHPGSNPAQRSIGLSREGIVKICVGVLAFVATGVSVHFRSEELPFVLFLFGAFFLLNGAPAIRPFISLPRYYAQGTLLLAEDYLVYVHEGKKGAREHTIPYADIERVQLGTVLVPRYMSGLIRPSTLRIPPPEEVPGGKPRDDGRGFPPTRNTSYGLSLRLRSGEKIDLPDFSPSELIARFIASRARAVAHIGYERASKGNGVKWGFRRHLVPYFALLARIGACIWFGISAICVLGTAEDMGKFEGPQEVPTPFMMLCFYSFFLLLYTFTISARGGYVEYHSSRFKRKRSKLAWGYTLFLFSPCAFFAKSGGPASLKMTAVWIGLMFPLLLGFIEILLSRSDDHDDALICYDLKSEEELNEAREETRKRLQDAINR